MTKRMRLTKAVILKEDADHSDSSTFDVPLSKIKAKEMFSSFNQYWNSNESQEENEEKSCSSAGYVTKLECREIMADANMRICRLELEAFEKNKKFQKYMKEIDDLVKEQVTFTRKSRSNSAFGAVQKVVDKVHVLHQMHALRKLRDEMAMEYDCRDSDTDSLSNEKDAIQTELDEYKRQSKQFDSNGLRAKVDRLLEEKEEMQQRQTTETSLRNSKMGHEVEDMKQQNEKLRKLRDEMTKMNKGFESKSSLLMKEKEALQSQFDALQQEIKSIGYWKRKALASEAETNDFRVKYEREFRRRRKLHNGLQDLKGNIRVFARCRPLLQHEIDQSAMEILDIPDSETVAIINPKQQTQRFRFDKVFDKNANNNDVYRETAPYIQSVLDGYNVTIFAYGQTGSGKTYTMTSVNNRALNDLFELQSKQESEWLFETNVSMLEIYNEQILDLLDEQGIGKKYRIHHKKIKKGKSETYIEGLLRLPVNSSRAVTELMEIGASHRTVTQTKMSAESSRSHSLLIVYVTAQNRTTGIKVNGKLNLIDLAGSERVKKSGVDGVGMTEAKHINKSLSALGDVIEALLKKNEHIPYRNSKLTFLLQDSLGQSAKTLMFINLCPAHLHFYETLTSLRFAQRAQKVELGKAVKM